MKHTVIITGGQLNIEFAKKYLKTLSYDRVFAVDKGLEYVDLLGIDPDYIVGDFDSISESIFHKYQCGNQKYNIATYPIKKDATDTELAIVKAIEDGSKIITLLGATGNRLDHVLANMDLLLQAIKKGVKCYIVDESNRIQLLHETLNNCCIIKKEHQFGKYISVIPVSEVVTGLSMRGVEYPLEHQMIQKGSTLTISNEITENEATIMIEQGMLFVIESKDGE